MEVNNIPQNSSGVALLILGGDIIASKSVTRESIRRSDNERRPEWPSEQHADTHWDTRQDAMRYANDMLAQSATWRHSMALLAIAYPCHSTSL